MTGLPFAWARNVNSRTIAPFAAAPAPLGPLRVRLPPPAHVAGFLCELFPAPPSDWRPVVMTSALVTVLGGIPLIASSSISIDSPPVLAYQIGVDGH